MSLRTSRYDRALRRWIPSFAKLTYYAPVKIALGVLDLPSRLIFPELRTLPPNYMRARIGVSNRLLANGIQYLMASRDFWLFCLERKIVTLQSTIVDIGCGCGRYAHTMRDMNFFGHRFTGSYFGIDIDEEMLKWCRENFDPERFIFLHSTHDSASYVNAKSAPGDVALPLEDGSADLVFSTSLFSHLLEDKLRNYVIESARILRPGGTMIMSVFCLDYPPPTMGNRHTFRHQIGNAFVESLSQPEAAVAYRERFLVELCENAGFSQIEMLTTEGLWQPRLLARR